MVNINLRQTRFSLPAGGNDGDVLTTDGGSPPVYSWMSGASEKSWAFRGSTAPPGTVYAGGFYKHAGAANDFSPSITFGTANASYAAHFFLVTGALTVDELTITVTGTSIDDNGVRTAGDSENIVIPNGTPANSYYEGKKWLGQITIEATAGTPVICDYGLCKYWDNNNTDFKVTGLEVTWLGGANDNGANFILRHHRGADGNTLWTYTGSGATPPPAIADMNTDHVTEIEIRNMEEGAWKRSNLSVNIDGDDSEGILWELITSAPSAIEFGTLLVRIAPQ